MYKSLLRPLLFRLDPELAHEITVEWLSRAGRFSVTKSLLNQLYGSRVPELPVELMGIHFPGPVGLAAGLDKEARCISALSALGFGHLELGTVTPKPQSGNPKPRMFRIPEHQAIVNRMGFNSGGIKPFLENIARTEKTVPLGINLGKNAITPIEHAAEDYITGLKQLYLYADYFTINISSPNTKNLRDLQSEDALDALLDRLMTMRQELADEFSRTVPVAVKIAPDIDNVTIPSLAGLLVQHGIDAVIATNTTIDHSAIAGSQYADEDGGMSGAPLKHRANEVVKLLYKELAGKVPVIGVGGIFSSEDAWQRLLAGAEMVQIYTGLIYHGPGIIGEIVSGLAQRVEQSGASTLQEAVRQARQSATQYN
jgi:dihydroorotate dehydrogenase